MAILRRKEGNFANKVIFYDKSRTKITQKYKKFCKTIAFLKKIVYITDINRLNAH